ncbi:DUF4302 domain-containing protein [Flavobacterium luteum]|nr:DUF4302 domain-containing protein [Flavobacterium luteum]
MKNLIKLILILIITLQFVGCENKEDITVFDQNATERLNTRTKELSDILLSSEYGWKAVYFTDSTQLGGFTHLFKFKDLKNVDMASDFDEDTSISSSEYKLELGSTVSLLFTTRNRIHLLSDSDNYPTAELRGQGYKGDFQFLYYGQENGEIIFRTNRSFEELRFVKATAQDWGDLAKNTTIRANLTGTIDSSLFKFLETNDGNTIEKFDFNYDVPSRFADATPIDVSSDETKSFAIAYTPTGIIVKPALTVNGQKLSVFTYDSETKNFVATGTGGVSAIIGSTNIPPLLTDDYKDLLSGNPETGFGYIAEYLEGASSNSPLFESIINEINAGLPPGVAIDRVQFIFNDGPFNYVAYTFTGGKKAILHLFTTTEDEINKAIIFTPGAWQENGKTIAAPAFLKNLDDQIMNSSGLYVKKENFNIAFSNDIYTFTSTTTPFRITTYSFQ